LSAILAFVISGHLLGSSTRQRTPPPATAPARVLTLAEAESTALSHEPRLAAAQLRADAGRQLVAEARAAYLPTVVGNVTGALTGETGMATAAGALTTSSLSDRFAVGGSLLQLITDFGRTSSLVSGAHFEHVAAEQRAELTRAQVILQLHEAYYGVLSAEAVLRAAQQALTNRRLTARQVTVLAQSRLKSTVDVGFANVLASEAELAVVRAGSTVERARAQLAAAMGLTSAVTDSLADEALPPPLPRDADTLIASALTARPDLQVLDAEHRAATALASADAKLGWPTLNLMGATGAIPYHDRTLHDGYAAIGFNLNVPLFTGGLLHARAVDARLQAAATGKDLDALRVRVTADVRVAFSDATDAYRSLDVTARLVAQTTDALRLAQTRYDNGLGSIVELNEAQLNETSAEITAADAKYTYLARRADLDYAVGQVQ
jgi:outer membrane protein